MRTKPPPGNVVRSRTSRKNFKFDFLSGKDEAFVQAGKWLVRLLALLFERDKTVKRYRSYPLIIIYKDAKGVDKQHIPHYEVERIDGSIEIHDVISSKQREQKSKQLRERAVEHYCHNMGWKYVIHTEITLPDATTAVNLYTLYGYAATIYCEDEVWKALLEDLEIGHKVKIHEISASIASDFGIPRGSVVATICWMIWNGELNTNMSVLLFIEGEVNKAAIAWRTGDQNEQEII